MKQLKITRCVGEGQGSCKRCSDKGKWNSMWTCILYKVEGYEGCLRKRNSERGIGK